MTGNYGHFLRLVTKCVNTSLRVLNKPKNLWKRPYAQNAFDLSKKKNNTNKKTAWSYLAVASHAAFLVRAADVN